MNELLQQVPPNVSIPDCPDLVSQKGLNKILDKISGWTQRKKGEKDSIALARERYFRFQEKTRGVPVGSKSEAEQVALLPTKKREV